MSINSNRVRIMGTAWLSENQSHPLRAAAWSIMRYDYPDAIAHDDDLLRAAPVEFCPDEMRAILMACGYRARRATFRARRLSRQDCGRDYARRRGAYSQADGIQDGHGHASLGWWATPCRVHLGAPA